MDGTNPEATMPSLPSGNADAADSATPAWRPTASPELRAEWARIKVDDLVRKAELTHNPLYLWFALYHHLFQQPSAPMPDECFNYLRVVCSNIYDIACGDDPRKPITRKQNESFKDFQIRLELHYQGVPSPLGGAAHIARALMLKRQGWDAFRSYANDRREERIARAYETEIVLPGHKSPFLERLRQSKADERTLRRKRSRGEKLIGRSLRPKPRP